MPATALAAAGPQFLARGWTENWVRSVEYVTPNLKAAAAAGNCSTGTLDRRLREEGTTFRKVVAEVQHQQAMEWLGESNARISDIAARLGYNDVGISVAPFDARQARVHAVQARDPRREPRALGMNDAAVHQRRCFVTWVVQEAVPYLDRLAEQNNR